MEKSKWQPVETMPEGERVLVTDGKVIEITSSERFFSLWLRSPITNVTHWMPLPEGP